MAAIALNTAGRVELIESRDQTTASCGVAVTAGAPVYIDANGNWALATGADAAHSTGIHVATKAGAKGESITAIRSGDMDGFNVSGMAYNDPIYIADAGGFATTAGTVSVVIARVRPATANSFANSSARDKIVRVGCPL